MKSYLFLAFALGAFLDHVFYQKTKAFQETSRTLQHQSQNIVSENKAFEEQVQQNPAAPTPLAALDHQPIAPFFIESSLQEETLTPGVFFEKDNARQSATEFAQRFAENIGLGPSSLRSHEETESENLSLQSFDFQQRYEGYDVYGSSIRLIMLKDNSELFLIGNQLKEISNFSHQINTDAARAETLILEEYKKFNAKIYKKPSEALVWPSPEAELAWIYLVRINGSNTGYIKVAVGAKSGKILMSQNASQSAEAFKPNFETDCLTKKSPADNEACLFLKNPFYSARQEFKIKSLVTQEAPYFWHSQRDGNSYQHQSVILRDLDSSGFLQNKYLSVSPGSKKIPRVSANKDSSWRFPHALCVSDWCQEDPKQRLGQVSTYYWANELRRFMKEKTGTFYADKFANSKKINFTTSINSYYLSSNYIAELRQINLYVKNYSIPKIQWNEQDSLLAEQILHEYGHANLHAASGVAENYYPKTTSLFFYACKNVAGCFLGISEGVAFLHSALPFESPKIFESHSFSGEGSYDLNTAYFANKSAADTFEKTFPKGEAHDMGLLYASIWWNIRRNWCQNFPLESNEEIRKAKVNRLFSEHMLLLRLSDTIPSAIAKTAKLARSLKGYGEPYAKAFEQEIMRRYSKSTTCRSAP